jgi:hypothetical protein
MKLWIGYMTWIGRSYGVSLIGRNLGLREGKIFYNFSKQPLDTPEILHIVEQMDNLI